MIKRQWLNPTNSDDTGWMKWGVLKEEDGGYESTLDIADCNRKISMNVGAYNKKARARARRKVRTMRDNLTDLLQQLEAIDQ